MKWFLNLLKSGWNWLISIPSKIKNIFSSSTNHNTRTQEQSQQNELPDNLRSQINELSNDVKPLILKDESILELIEKYSGAFSIFRDRNGFLPYLDEACEPVRKNLPNYLLSIQKLIEGNQELIGVLNSKGILDGSYKRCYTPDNVIMHCGLAFYYNSGFIELLEHLARKDETVLNRITNHSELAKRVLLMKKGPAEGKLCTNIFDILFSQDQEDILEKLEYDLDFTIDTLSKAHHSNGVKDFLYKMSCLKNKEDVRLLKCVHNSGYSYIAYDLSQQYNPWQQLIKKFFEHHYNDPFIYKMAINLENIDLRVQIDIIINNNRDEDIVYDETSKQYKVHLKNSYKNDDIDTIIDKVLNKHFERIGEIVKERSPNYLKEELSNHMPSNGASPENVSTSVNEPHDLSSIRLSQVDKSLNRS